jgi:hypothetical protein
VVGGEDPDVHLPGDPAVRRLPPSGIGVQLPAPPPGQPAPDGVQAEVEPAAQHHILEVVHIHNGGFRLDQWPCDQVAALAVVPDQVVPGGEQPVGPHGNQASPPGGDLRRYR